MDWKVRGKDRSEGNEEEDVGRCCINLRKQNDVEN